MVPLLGIQCCAQLSFELALKRLDAAIATFPWLSKALGVKRKTPLVSRGHLSEASAALLCKLACLPAAVTRTITTGAKTVLRTKAFMARLIVQVQQAGLMLMLLMLSALKPEPGPPECDQQCVAVGFAHTWDETKQLLREFLPRSGANAYLRRPTQRVGRSIVVQQSMVHAMAVRQDAAGLRRCLRSETFLIPAVQVTGKTARHLALCLQRGPVPMHNTQAMAQMAASVSVLLLTPCCDAASTNVRLLKHWCGLCEQPAFPENVVLDPSHRCFLHLLHRIKTRLLEGHALVSMMYCFAKPIKNGNLLGRLAENMGERVRKIRRCIAPPPADAQRRTRRVFDLIYSLESSHHLLFGKRGIKKSTLITDLEFLMSVDNGGLADRADLVHFCWKSDGSGPCCYSDADCADKAEAAYLNLFLCHACPAGSLSRWTHVGTTFALLCAGYVCRDALLSAVLETFGADPNAVMLAATLDPASAGAGDADMQRQHAARIEKCRTCMAKPETRMQVGSLFLATKRLDTVMYLLMGGNRPGEGRNRKPGTPPRLDEQVPVHEVIGQTRDAAEGFVHLLRDWEDPESDSQALLLGMGVQNEEITADTSLRRIRRMVLGMSCGLFRRFTLRLSSFPLLLWILAALGADEGACRAAAESFCNMRGCCIGWFGRRLRSVFPNPDALLSQPGRAAIAVCLRSHSWSIYAAEKEHSSCRRLVHGAGPARNWSLVARDRLLECSRTIHIERTSFEPSLAPQAVDAPDRAVAVEHGADPLQPAGVAPHNIDFRLADISWGTDVSSMARPAADALLAPAAGDHDDGGEARYHLSDRP